MVILFCTCKEGPEGRAMHCTNLAITRHTNTHAMEKKEKKMKKKLHSYAGLLFGCGTVRQWTGIS